MAALWPREAKFHCNECRLSPRDQADRARGASRGLARPHAARGGLTRGQGAASRGQAQPHAAKARPVIQAHPSHRYIIDTEEDWNPRLAGKSRITRVSGQVGRALF